MSRYLIFAEFLLQANWTAGFLPAEHQAITFSAAEPIRNLARPKETSSDADEATLSFLRFINKLHA